MSILDVLFGRPGAQGHWDNSGFFGRLHTRSLPQVGCRVCEQEGWIPASPTKPPMIARTTNTPSPDATRDYLADARGKVVNAIADIRLATMDTDTFACQVALDALHDALTAIEAQMPQMEAHHAQE